MATWTPLAGMMNDQVAAVILEPIQSIAGCAMADADYYRGLRALCDKWGALLIFDEIQTGLGRTGKLWVGEHWGVTPDMITLAKGIASGVPMGATLVSQPHRRRPSTWMSTARPSAAGRWPAPPPPPRSTYPGRGPARARRRDGRADQGRRWAACPMCVEVRGLGLLLGLEPRHAGQGGAGRRRWTQGIILGTSGDPNVLRLMPPMVVTEADVEHLVSVLGRNT